ncbi:MAG TPA: hypothetical protein VFS26_00505 [Solirubrobacterales bacterium]|nr:hypothetical protein [Solirubrobacterales bacterium]
MRPPAVIALACAAVLAGGCGDQDDSTPVACLEGAATYERALAAAPDEVLLGRETSISDCLAPNQTGGDLARVGEAMVEAATALNAEARAEPAGDAALRLGYLLGAAERGAEESEGIHTDLVRRLTIAARYAPGNQPLSQKFLSDYRDGFDAGRTGG